MNIDPNDHTEIMQTDERKIERTANREYTNLQPTEEHLLPENGEGEVRVGPDQRPRRRLDRQPAARSVPSQRVAASPRSEPPPVGGDRSLQPRPRLEPRSRPAPQAVPRSATDSPVNERRRPSQYPSSEPVALGRPRPSSDSLQTTALHNSQPDTRTRAMSQNCNVTHKTADQTQQP